MFDFFSQLPTSRGLSAGSKKCRASLDPVDKPRDVEARNIEHLETSYSVHFPKEKYAHWHIFTPSYFSTYFIVLFRVVVRCHLGTSDIVSFKPPPSVTHTFHVHHVHGMETLEINAISLSPDNHYVVYCCGMEENAMNFDVTTIKANQNAIVFNYPSKGRSKGNVRTARDIIKPTIQQVKRLLDKGIPANKITLYGYSLGGGVAAKSARKLQQQGHSVHLTIERSFDRFSSVVPALVNKMNAKKVPIVTSILSLAVYGFTFGVAFAGCVTSLGYLMAGAFDGIAYIGARFLHAVGLLLQKILNGLGDLLATLLDPFSKEMSIKSQRLFYKMGHYANHFFYGLAIMIQKTLSIVASSVAGSVNMAASLIGAMISISGLILGVVLGAALGLLMSVQLLWTNKPLTLSIIPAFRCIFYAFDFEMDSVSELKQLIAAHHHSKNKSKDKPKITIINTIDDEVIDHNVALNTGLGLKPGNNHHSAPLKDRITSFWYSKGGHRGKLDDVLRTESYVLS